MEVERLLYLLALIILLFFSAFFSGSEVALFGLDKKKLNNYFADNKIILRYLNSLLSNQRRLLITILVGNNLVNVAISIISVALVSDFANQYNLDLNLMIGLQIVIVSSLILLFGELLPKMIATRYQISLLKFITIPLYFFNVIIFPVAELISELIHFATSKIKFDKKKFAIDKDEIADITQISSEKLNLNQDEKDILESLTELKDIYVFEIMTPRVDIVALSVKEDIDQAIDTIMKSGHSRIPVYENSIDNIIGVVHAKDLLKFNINPKLKKGAELKSLIKKVLFVPETKKINDLLNEFQLKKNHLAIVVDEYGGTAGLITLEDIIEEVLGDIWDEFDKSESGIQRVSDNEFVINAKLKISDFEEETNIKIDIDENMKDESFAGFILSHFGQIPEEGASFEVPGIKITAIEVAKKRIKKVRLVVLNS